MESYVVTDFGTRAYPPAATFNDLVPTAADTDQWCQAIASFGGRWATLVAKHECGFALWPTKVRTTGFKETGAQMLPSVPAMPEREGV